ncbi:MAG: DUF1294 domain-containing protein [Gammaproteobacteria bacterium]
MPQIKGVLTSWDDDKGFGFITPDAGGRDVFVHITAFKGYRRKRPQSGQPVRYQLSEDDRGRLRAVGVRLPRRVPTYDLQKISRVLVAAAFPLIPAFFAVVLIALVLSGDLPPLLLIYYAFVSLATFTSYALDKSAAREGRWRTAENTLQVMALMGGWPGALVAQNNLRHKSKKFSFRIVFWAVTLCNIAFLLWLLSPYGADVNQVLWAWWNGR